MCHQKALGRVHVALQVRRHKTGSGGCHDHVGRAVSANIREYALFELELFGNVLLNEVGTRGHRVQIGREAELAFRRQRRRCQARERGLRIFHCGADPTLHFRFGIGRNDVDAKVQRARRPATADHPGAQ